VELEEVRVDGWSGVGLGIVGMVEPDSGSNVEH
jgi:hypothetical protein